MTASYTAGTVSVTAGSDIVTGSGTGWLASNISPGYFGVDSANGNPVPVLEVLSDTSMRLVKPWRGTSASGQAYWLSYDTRDGQQTVNNAQRLAEYIALLRSSFFTAFSGLSPSSNTLPYFASGSSAALTSITALGRALLASSTVTSLLSNFGPVFGGKAPLPSGADVGMVDGNFNTVSFAGCYTIAGSWSNGPLGSEQNAYTGILVVYARQFNNGYWQLLRLSNGNDYQRFTTSSDASSWPNAWEKLTSISFSNVWTASQTVDAGGGYVAWRLTRGNLTGLLEALATNVLQLATATASPIAVRTNNTERMRISETGVVLVGTPDGISPVSGSNTGHHLEANGRYHRRADGYAPFIQSRLSNSGAVQEFYQGTTQVGTINVAAASTSYNTSSDYRLKENVEPLVTFSLTPEQFDLLDDSLLRVMSYEPVSYNWKRTGERAHGFIAHVLQQAAPHAVSGVKDGVRSVGIVTRPERIMRAKDAETGEITETVIPSAEIPDSYPDQAGEGETWTKTHDEPDFQGVDHSKLVADLTAAIQSLTVMALSQADRIEELNARVEILEGENI